MVGPGAEGGASSGGGVLEGALGGAGGHVGRVGEGEAQSTRGVDVDALAAGDDDILYISLVSRFCIGCIVIDLTRKWSPVRRVSLVCFPLWGTP